MCVYVCMSLSVLFLSAVLYLPFLSAQVSNVVSAKLLTLYYSGLVAEAMNSSSVMCDFVLTMWGAM